jgi:large repetitive protein
VFTTTVPATTGTTALSATSTVATATPESNTANNSATDSLTTVAPISNAVVSGKAYYDINRNRFYDPAGDAPLVGYRVELLRVTGTTTVVVGTATTDASGDYTIGSQAPGIGYRVQFRDPSGTTLYATPFNQATVTQGGQPSTGNSSLTSAISPSQTVVAAGFIDNITLYAGDNTVNQNLPLDPSGVVYDSVQRSPIAGATVRLVGPAGFDPAVHLIGGVGNVAQVTPAIGAYRFDLLPIAPSGLYSLQVTPPSGYANVPAAQGGVAAPQGTFNVPPGMNAIQVQSTPPAQGVIGVGPVGGAGTQYFLEFQFTLPGSGDVVNNHIPLDPLAAGAILINKVGNKTVAEVGDSVQYTIRVRNTTGAPIAGVQVEDVLPPGFRYILETARLGGAVIANPSGGVGRNLTFSLGAIAANSTAELTYFVRIGVGSAQGDGTNRATAVFTAGGVVVRSNTAQYKVNVQGGVFSNDGCIVGKVYADCDGDHMQNNASGSRELGIPGVRLVMLDGSYVITDSEGKYSLCGVKSQTHVLKIDRTTLPKGSRLVPSSNRNAGVGDSLFVDLKAGELARADFIEGSCSPEVLDQIKARRAQGGVAGPETEKDRPLKIDNLPGGVQQILPRARQTDLLPAMPAGGVR